MSINIEFAGDQPTPKEAETYTGLASDWPDGVYRLGSGLAYIVVCRGSVLTVCEDGKVDNPNHSWYSPFARISSDPRIASITFAGSMDYPDGKPVDTESQQEPTLSDPCDLKVGDWVSWGSDPLRVVKVDKERNIFWIEDDPNPAGWWFMNGLGYTVVPAPKGGA